MTFDLAPLLDLWQVDYDPGKSGNQKVNCPSPSHDDRVASASLNLDDGLLNCFGCQLNGDAIKLLMELEGLEIGDAFRRAEELTGPSRKQVQRGPDRGGTFLPRGPGTRARGRGWKSPWAGRRP